MLLKDQVSGLAILHNFSDTYGADDWFSFGGINLGYDLLYAVLAGGWIVNVEVDCSLTYAVTQLIVGNLNNRCVLDEWVLWP